MPHVVKTDSCWNWNGYIRKDGYVNFKVRDKKLKAHRVAYEFFHGAIPDGLEIDHICRNRQCVNPDHLRAVTHLQNMHRDKDHDFVPTIRKQGRVCKICDCRRKSIYRQRNRLAGVN